MGRIVLVVFFLFLFSCDNEISRVRTEMSDNNDVDDVCCNDELPDKSINDVDDTVDADDLAGCDFLNSGNDCVADQECGACMICVAGTCEKGCTSDNDCKMEEGLKCNRKQARCANFLASLQSCSERACPFGCCYAEKGLTDLKCLTPTVVSTCGMCKQGEIYMPSEKKCVSAVCKDSNDCLNLNTNSTAPAPYCFDCKANERICYVNFQLYGCSVSSY